MSVLKIAGLCWLWGCPSLSHSTIARVAEFTDKTLHCAINLLELCVYTPGMGTDYVHEWYMNIDDHVHLGVWLSMEV